MTWYMKDWIVTLNSRAGDWTPWGAGEFLQPEVHLHTLASELCYLVSSLREADRLARMTYKGGRPPWACPEGASSALEEEARSRVIDLFSSQKRAGDQSSGLLYIRWTDVYKSLLFSAQAWSRLWLKSKSYTNTGLLGNMEQAFKLSLQPQSPIQALTKTDPA